MKELLFLGVFVDRKFLMELLDKECFNLSNSVSFPHVTLAYKPTNIDNSILGQEVQLALTGYANDGKNEGYSVELIDPSEKILNAIEPGRILHLTTSVSETGAPKDTQFLDFKPIDRIILKGTVGVMQSDNTIRGL